MSPIPNGKIGKLKQKEKKESKAQKQRMIQVHESLWTHTQKLNPLIHVSGGTYQ